MTKTATIMISAALTLATATGALAAAKKPIKVNADAASSLASATMPSEPAYFAQAKGDIN